MPRNSRKNQKSFTGVYHIIFRGINSQEVFFDNMDREKFIKEIKNTKEKYKYKMLSYVLMTNHIHMLIKDENNCVSKAMQSLAIRYAMYFNKKYERIGHVFYNRFHSKCVENENYLLNVHRYIHRNPEKDGICKMERYKWSSYQEYIGMSNITETEFILSFFGLNTKEAIEKWKAYHENVENVEIYEDEYEVKCKLTDDEAINEIKSRLEIENIIEIQKYSAEYKKEIIRNIAKIKGITQGQIARILGVNRQTIYRAMLKKYKDVSLL